MKETPLLQQYNSFKNRYKDKIVLFRMGDFFETFGDDAKITSKTLNITLTQRNKNDDPTPLAGFPHHALDQYLPKLVQANLSVVIVDQVEDPKLAKGIVKRAVTKIVTPGTIDSNENISRAHNVLSLGISKGNIGIAICDLYNGEVFISSVKDEREIGQIISTNDIVEILLPNDKKVEIDLSLPIQIVSIEKNDPAQIITDHFKINSVHSIGIENNKEIINALAQLIYFFNETQKDTPRQINKVKWLNNFNFIKLDSATIRNLELVDSISGHSLFSILDRCETNMGKRTLRNWILNPLVKVEDIKRRADAVTFFFNKPDLLEKVSLSLAKISDIERITGRIGLMSATARDFKALSFSISSSDEIISYLGKNIDNSSEFIKKIVEESPIINLNELKSLIEKTIKEEPVNSITEGNIIKEGFDQKLDELRSIALNSKSWLATFEKKEREETGISSLKVKFNKVFGYFIEITNTHKEKVPSNYVRKQTMVNCERYITEELKEKEDIILNSQEKIASLEFEIFQKFREQTVEYIEKLQKLAEILSVLDVICNFAKVAIQNDYIRPIIADDKNGKIEIKNARHPVVEKAIKESFIPNDILLDNQSNNLVIITGPNMSGKSTYIRQVAMLVLMAHIGSYIPAADAHISIVDKIFTRIGASDDLSGGRSTFMVEMDEVSNITNNATAKSLVILDEVGRGTSTYDGISIAWAIASFLLNKVGAKTVFATHYHELMKLQEKYPQKVKNYNVAVSEDIEKDEVVFLRKIREGGTDKSYGIYVAKMAGLQEEIIKEAKNTLLKLTTTNGGVKNRKRNQKEIDTGEIKVRKLF